MRKVGAEKRVDFMPETFREASSVKSVVIMVATFDLLQSRERLEVAGRQAERDRKRWLLLEAESIARLTMPAQHLERRSNDQNAQRRSALGRPLNLRPAMFLSALASNSGSR